MKERWKNIKWQRKTRTKCGRLERYRIIDDHKHKENRERKNFHLSVIYLLMLHMNDWNVSWKWSGKETGRLAERERDMVGRRDILMLRLNTMVIKAKLQKLLMFHLYQIIIAFLLSVRQNSEKNTKSLGVKKKVPAYISLKQNYRNLPYFL